MRCEHLRAALGFGAAAVLAAACSSPSSNATSPSNNKTLIQASEDVASVSANELSTDVADYQLAEVDTRVGGNFGPGLGPILGMLGGGSPGTAGGGLFGGGGFGWGWGAGGGWGAHATADGSCAMDSAGFEFTFPPSNPVDTIAYSRTWQYFSATGCEPAYVADSTDSVASTFAFLGVMSDDSGAWAGRHQGSSANALTGTQEPGTDSVLAGASTHVWNGNSTTADSVSFSGTGQQRRHHWLAYDTTTNVTFPNPRHDDFFPVGGTWTRWLTDSLAVSGDTTITKDIDLHLVLTFSAASSGQGSQTATLKVYDASSGTLIKTCTVDLRWGRMTPNSCH